MLNSKWTEKGPVGGGFDPLMVTELEDLICSNKLQHCSVQAKAIVTFLMEKGLLAQND